MKKFNLKREKRKLWLRTHRSQVIKYGTLSLSVVILVVTIILYSKASFNTKVTFDVIDARVAPFQNGDAKVVAYNYDGEKHDTPPAQNSGYVIDNIECSNADGIWNHSAWKLELSNIVGKVKCNLTFKIGTLVNFRDYLKGLSDSETVIQDDGTDDKNMRFIGSNPNNYVNFVLSDGTKEKWRIIGVFNSNSHGQSEELVKIVRNDNIDTLSWDENNSSNWNNSTLKNYLNNSYYSSMDEILKSMIYNVVWRIGGEPDSVRTPKEFYIAERGSVGTYNCSTNDCLYANMKIGLIYPSDYGYASSSCDAENKKLSTYNDNECISTNWLIQSSFHKTYWTLSPRTMTNNISYVVINSGKLDYNYSNTKYYIFPSVYLKPTVMCINCSDSDVGTYDNPYEIYYQEATTTNTCIVTKAGENGFYAKYVCDGVTGTISECYYSETVGATSGGTMCDGGRDGSSYKNYMCMRATDSAANLGDRCVYSYYGTQVDGGGGMSSTISCSCN